ncbi:MAG: conjugal transfer protein TraR [Chloroflexi bacterium]|nr:conjugal transfer protein TraR [Chloroflexota bacterium]
MESRAKSKKIEDLKAYLEAERERLKRGISGSAMTIDEERPGYSSHMAEDATEVFEQAMNVGQRRDHELLLFEVEDALRRMEQGTYGVCQHCGEQIDRARLRALPTASLCYACQDRLEHR